MTLSPTLRLDTQSALDLGRQEETRLEPLTGESAAGTDLFDSDEMRALRYRRAAPVLGGPIHANQVADASVGSVAPQAQDALLPRDPFPGLSDGEEVSGAEFGALLKSKYVVRRLMLGSASLQHPKFHALLPGPSLRGNPLLAESIADFSGSLEAKLVHPDDAMILEDAAASIANGDKPWVFKPSNGSACGTGLDFVEPGANGMIELTLADLQRDKTLLDRLEASPGVSRRRAIEDQGLIKFQVISDAVSVLGVLEALSTCNSQRWSYDTVPPTPESTTSFQMGIIEEMFSGIKVGGKSFELRFHVTGWYETDHPVRISISLARIGASGYFANRTGRSQATADRDAPYCALVEELGYSTTIVKLMDRVFTESVADAFVYLSKRLKAGGIHLSDREAEWRQHEVYKEGRKKEFDVIPVHSEGVLPDLMLTEAQMSIAIPNDFTPENPARILVRKPRASDRRAG